jgi:glycosyltransferase A (GT-A) superfamily protein (DUF2064 family)
MERWLGGDVMLVAQSGKSEADRYRTALETVFGLDSASALIVAPQCPALTRKHLQQALGMLQQQEDMVVGPTGDGGCYLVGFNNLHPDVLAGIDWSGDNLAQQLKQAGHANGLKVAELEPLRDCDSDEDLVYHWALGYVQD